MKGEELNLTSRSKTGGEEGMDVLEHHIHNII